MTVTADRRSGQVEDGPARPDLSPPRAAVSFAMFAEVLLVGVVVAVASLGVVTALPALAAGAVHLRRHLDGEQDRIVDLLGLVLAACRGGWLVSLGAVAAGVVLGFNVWLLGTGDADRFRVSGAVSGALLAALVVVLLRTAGAWTPGADWWPVVRAAALRSAADLPGTLMLALALALAATIVWMFVPLAVTVGGLLSLAALSVERRSARDDSARDDSARDDSARDD